MKWTIPAKTFLLGEYAAIGGAPAILLTTAPCFEISITDSAELQGIHMQSPAGLWWHRHGHPHKGLLWNDPYHGRGGMGASSAQFIGAYLASQSVPSESAPVADILQAYLECSYCGQGVPPSGYDLIAQLSSGCVYIDRQREHTETFDWPFQDIGFLLLHTGKKLATHEHLQSLPYPRDIEPLERIVNKARNAFESADSSALVDAVNAYHQELTNLNLVLENSLAHIAHFQRQSDVLAIKGCGAMGADILLLVVPIRKLDALRLELSNLGWYVVATSAELFL